MPKPKMYGQRDIITHEELDELMIKLPSPIEKSLVSFLYLTGCRIGEALQIRNRDIEFTDDKMNIRIRTLKTKATLPYRTLWISLDAPYIDVINERTQQLTGPDDLMWPIHYRTFLRRVNAINPNIWPHLFRHTRLTLFAQKGFTEFQLQRWTGWVDTRPAKRYVHQSDKLIEKMGDSVD